MYRKLYLFLVIALRAAAHGQTLIPNLPDVILDTNTNSVGYITGFEHDSITKKLYIAGQFNRVGNVNRQGFAVIDLTTGNVLNDLSFITLSDLSFSNKVKARLKIYKNRLYIGGAFNTTSGDFLFSVNLTNNNVRSLYNLAPLSDFEIYNAKIYTSGAYYTGAAEEFDVNEMDTLGNISWQRSIINVTNEHLTSLAARNNTLFVGGVFSSFGGVSLRNIARVDLNTHTITTWQPNPMPGPAGNTNCFDVFDIAVLPNDVLLDIGYDICGNPPKSVQAYSIASGNLNAQIQTIPYSASSEFIVPETDTSYWFATLTGGLRLYGLNSYVGSWSPALNGLAQPFARKSGYILVGGNFTTVQGSPQKGLAVYCKAPDAPKKLSVFSKACQGQNLFYVVSQVKYATSYSWSYTGTGVTINGSGSNAWLYFSSSATSGTFKICAKSYCGAPSDTLYIPFTVYAPPNVNAGPDVTFTCSNNIDTLYGTSATPGATFAWYGPSYNSNAAVNQITNTVLSGNYVLWVTDPVSGCMSKDTAKVMYDTFPPVINHNLAYGQLNCATPVVTLDASALYPVNTNLHWSGNSFSQANPANITVAGIYTLTITSGTNDCVSKDTFQVTANYVPPDISAPAVLDTITCARDSVQLSANTSSLNTILYWKNSNGDTLANPSYTQQSGAYSAHALDTSNGCTNQLIRSISQYTTPPAVQIAPGNYQVNCSFSSATLSGSSATPGATLGWSGPNNFTSANPATTSQAGYYYLTATNPQNGCTQLDSVEVVLQNTLLLTGSADTTLCNGGSAVISASPIGGTPGFTYAWSNNGGSGATATVSPADTTTYIVTVTDNAGCVGSDTIVIIVPAPVGDSVNTFQPCDPNNPNGQIQAYGTGGIPPYQFALNGGAMQASGIFANLNFGTYTVTVQDNMGCATVFSAIIDSTSLLPAPDFILSTSQIQGDTFVLVDISNPRPDSAQWLLPPNCVIVNNDPFNPVIVQADTGAFQVTMLAWFGPCQMQLTKNIVVIPADTNLATAGNDNGIADLVLYPNPNSGQFTVDVTFYKKQSCALFIFDALGNELFRLPFSETDFASANISLNNPAPGTYVLKVIAEYDSKYKIFLIDQQ